MRQGITGKKIFFLVFVSIAVALALEAAFVLSRERTLYAIAPETMRNQEIKIYPEEEYLQYNVGYEIQTNGLKTVQEDPQLCFRINQEEAISNVSFYFFTPTSAESLIQVFYPDQEVYTEQNSVKTIVPAGMTYWAVEIPEAKYTNLRIDIDSIQEVIPLESVAIGNLKPEWTWKTAGLDPVRIAVMGALLFALLLWGAWQMRKAREVGPQSGNRNAAYDLMRILAMILVVMQHMPVKPLQDSVWTSTMFETIFLVSNSLFFMLSGRLSLGQKFETKADIVLFYKKKLVGLVLPFFLFMMLLRLTEMLRSGEPFTFMDYLISCYRALMGDYASSHLWFMYNLIGIQLSAPFLGMALQKMSNNVLKLLIGVAIGWNVLSVYLTADLGLSFGYSGWILGGWMMHFVAGYAIHRLSEGKNHFGYCWALGLLGLVLTVVFSAAMPNHFQYACDLSPLFLLYSGAVFLFFDRKVHITHAGWQRICSKAAGYTFMVYMVHMPLVKDWVVPQVPAAANVGIQFITYTVITLAASFLISIAFTRIIVAPLQKLLRRVLKLH